MKINLYRADDLTAEQIAAWSDLQQADPAVDSPYFRPEFTQAVAAVRDDVEVAVLEEAGEPVGYFPFQRGHLNVGMPVGGRLSDCHGLVVRPEVAWDAEELIRGCGLAGWRFHHLVAAQQPFQRWHETVAPSPYMDLSEGFEAYRAGRQAAGSAKTKQIARKLRKFEREVGPLRFELHRSDRRVFEMLIRWKTEQYFRTGLTNVFGFHWTVALLERILEERNQAFCGMLSALWLGERLVAVELGMRSHGVLHSWFPAYDREFARYSPGTILTLEIARAAESLGIRRFDLGKGSEPYKLSLMSDSFPVAEGGVDLRLVGRLARRGWHRTRDRLHASPLRRPLQRPISWVRQFRDWLSFR